MRLELREGRGTSLDESHGTHTASGNSPPQVIALHTLHDTFDALSLEHQKCHEACEGLLPVEDYYR